MEHPLVGVVLRSMLPMFFFLGGFLVTGSALRLQSVGKFFIFRVFRIVPALLVEVTLSAVVLGAVLTTLPWQEYFAHVEFRTYFLNILGIVHYTLPGVFRDHPMPIVNVNLWTLPPDFYGYACMLLIMGIGILYNRRLFLCLFLAASALLGYFFLQRGGGLIPLEGKAPYISGLLFVYCFFVGVLCYLFMDKIPLRKSLLALSALGTLGLASDATAVIGIFSACYLCLCLGFVDMRRFPLVSRGDYSYGVYLYSFPIQQTLWHCFPALRDPVSLTVAAIPLSLAFAVLSWHWIEKPILNLRKKIGPVRS